MRYSANPFVEVIEMELGTWSLLSPGSCSTLCYLVAGEDKALLIDTGFGVGDMKGLSEFLAPGKELSVVIIVVIAATTSVASTSDTSPRGSIPISSTSRISCGSKKAISSVMGVLSRNGAARFATERAIHSPCKSTGRVSSKAMRPSCIMSCTSLSPDRLIMRRNA